MLLHHQAGVTERVSEVTWTALWRHVRAHHFGLREAFYMVQSWCDAPSRGTHGTDGADEHDDRHAAINWSFVKCSQFWAQPRRVNTVMKLKMMSDRMSAFLFPFGPCAVVRLFRQSPVFLCVSCTETTVNCSRCGDR